MFIRLYNIQYKSAIVKEQQAFNTIKFAFFRALYYITLFGRIFRYIPLKIKDLIICSAKCFTA